MVEQAAGRLSPALALRGGRRLPAIPGYSLADYWLTSIQLGLVGLPGRHVREAAARILNPLSYPRMLEYELLHELVGPLGRKRVLDLGSPKLPAMLIARDPSVEIHATDIREYFIAPTAHFLRRSGLGRRLGAGVHLRTADGRALPYDSEAFDVVYSVSVVEHIPGDGDSEAMAEIARVLKPGGVAFLSVPFNAAGYKEEWVKGAVYERKFVGEPVFYQRHYDRDALTNRIINPSGLQLRRVIWFGEPGFRFERYWNRISMQWKLPLLWAQPFIAKVLFKRLATEDVDRATGVALLLTKPPRLTDS